MTEITPNSSPLYLQLREIIRNKIESGEYQPGTAIPSENELAERYGMHRLSVRASLSALVFEGLLKSIQGKGLFVTGKKKEYSIATVGGFKKALEKEGHKVTTRLLLNSFRKAGPLYAKIFDIKPDDIVYFIKSVSCSDGVPFNLEETYIPKYLVPHFEEVDLNVFSVKQVLGFNDVFPVKAGQRLELEKPEPKDARILDVDPSTALFKFQEITYDKKHRVVEFVRSYTRSDYCDFTVTYVK